MDDRSSVLRATGGLIAAPQTPARILTEGDWPQVYENRTANR